MRRKRKLKEENVEEEDNVRRSTNRKGTKYYDEKNVDEKEKVEECWKEKDSALFYSAFTCISWMGKGLTRIAFISTEHCRR